MDWLWRDEESGLGFRFVEQEEDESEVYDPAILVFQDEDELACISLESARELASALLEATKADKVDSAVTGNAGFQVYYKPEHGDSLDRLVVRDGFGEPDEEGAHVWEEPDVTSLRSRIAWLASEILSSYEAQEGECSPSELPEEVRAWISVYRMPEDLRVWRGYCEEFESVSDEELYS